MPIWLTEQEDRILAAVCDRLVPGEPGKPSASSAGAPQYIDQLLGAFSFDPPRIWAGGPYSGRFGGEEGFSRFHQLSALDELAWRTRIEGSSGHPERELLGPVVGWQEQYRRALAELGPDFPDASPADQDAALRSQGEFVDLVYGHVCEAMYGAPEYGGNRDRVGWEAIGFAGDVQPRGWTPSEVSNPGPDGGSSPPTSPGPTTPASSFASAIPTTPTGTGVPASPTGTGVPASPTGTGVPAVPTTPTSAAVPATAALDHEVGRVSDGKC